MGRRDGQRGKRAPLPVDHVGGDWLFTSEAVPAFAMSSVRTVWYTIKANVGCRAFMAVNWEPSLTASPVRSSRASAFATALPLAPSRLSSSGASGERAHDTPPPPPPRRAVLFSKLISVNSYFALVDCREQCFSHHQITLPGPGRA